MQRPLILFKLAVVVWPEKVQVAAASTLVHCAILCLISARVHAQIGSSPGISREVVKWIPYQLMSSVQEEVNS